MRSWWKPLVLLAAMASGLGFVQTAAYAQFPPPGHGYGMPPGMGMPPHGGMMGMPPPGMGMPHGGMMGMPPGMDPKAMRMGGMGLGAFGAMPPGMGAEFPNAAPPSQEPVSPFSIKDEGMPNAFSDAVDPRPGNPIRWHLSLGYTMMFFKKANLPHLATTGSVTDPVPGALGQPNTVITAGGGRDPGLSSVFSPSLIIWLVDPGILCFDVNFFIMEQRSLITNFKSDNDGSPLITRPFFNASARTEDADPRAFPTLFRGTMSDVMMTRLMGAEGNLKWYNNYLSEGASFGTYIGVRWLRLDERYSSFDTADDIIGGGFNTTFSDNYTTYNQFYGGQVGGELRIKSGRFTAALHGKMAVGPNAQTLTIRGQTVQFDTSNGNIVDAQNEGLYAQPKNVGIFRETQLSVLSEMGFRCEIDLSDRIRFTAGYSFLYLTNVIRPGDNINRSVEIQPLGVFGLFPATDNRPPTFQQTFFNAHTINFGLEFLF